MVTGLAQKNSPWVCPWESTDQVLLLANTDPRPWVLFQAGMAAAHASRLQIPKQFPES